MQIDLISVGQIKEKYIQNGIDDYKSRVSKFCKINEVILKDVNNELGEKEVLKQEASRILEKLNKRTYLIVLDIDGKSIGSVEFSKLIENIQIRGYSHITFLIGGSLGIDEEIKKQADYKLSFSKMTFPHQLFKLILLEQIYRSFKIMNNHTYHK